MKKSVTSHNKKRSYQKAERAGRYAEYLICLTYLLRGFRLLHWRHRTLYGEIDLIMARGQHIRFIEVKYRKDGLTSDAPLSAHQIARIRRAALASYHDLSADGRASCQCDIILVSRLCHITRFENHINL